MNKTLSTTTIDRDTLAIAKDVASATGISLREAIADQLELAELAGE